MCSHCWQALYDNAIDSLDGFPIIATLPVMPRSMAPARPHHSLIGYSWRDDRLPLRDLAEWVFPDSFEERPVTTRGRIAWDGNDKA